MGNSIRPTAASELKEPLAIISKHPHGWWALHTALVHAAQIVQGGESHLDLVALSALQRATDAGFRSETDESSTRFLGMPIMMFQDALFVVNELPEWRFPDEVLLVGWLVECGGRAMGRGPARADYQEHTPEHYVDGSRTLFNRGEHGNGPGWPRSTEWPRGACRYMMGPAARV